MAFATRFERSPHPYYELLEPAGEGGMGVVYKARDKRLNRLVALKFLSSSRTDPDDAIKRFQREAESIAALNHPNIATLFEIGEWAGEPFIAMEYLPGKSLADRRKRGPATHEELWAYAADLGAGLHFGHAKGILHRDIKPSNAMFSEHGILKLVDFGLAKPKVGEDITRAGNSVGTLGYVAPEILQGEPATVQSDLYALGATLYEMASGKRMFQAADLGPLVEQILRAKPQPLSSLRPDLPDAFNAAINRAISRSPRDRFVSVREFVDQLRPPAQTGSFTRSMTTAYPTRKPLRWWALWAALAVAILVSALAMAHIWNRGVSLAGRTVAVLPFENLGGGPEGQSLCDGLQETVTALVSASSGARKIFVIPSSEIRRSQVHTIAEARKEFRADLAISGSVQRTSNLLRITLALDDASKLREINSRMVSTSAAAAAELQEKLATELGSLLGPGTPLERPLKTGQATANSAAYALYLEGVGYIETRKVEDAIASLTKALDADPQFASARVRLAEAYLWKNDFTQDPKWLALADEEVSRAVKSGSGRETLLAEAMIKKATGDYESAIVLFRKLLASEPANIEAYQLLSQTLSAANRPSQAEAVLQQAVHLRPAYWPIHNTLGLFYMARRENVKAEAEFGSAAALAPDVAVIYSNLGALYFGMSRWADAARSFEKSLAIAPNALAHANLGTVYFYQGRFEDAVKQAQASTAIQPANPVNWGNLGDAQWQIRSHRAAARDAFERAALLSKEQLTINPANVRIRKSYALYLAKLGRASEALEQIGSAIEQAPKDATIQFYAARVYAVTGDTSRALAALQACRALGFGEDEIQREPDLAVLNKGRTKQ